MDLGTVAADDVGEDLADLRGVEKDSAGERDLDAGGTDPETAQDDLGEAGQFGCGGGENLTGEGISGFGGGEHDGIEMGEAGMWSAVAALHELLAGRDAPELHDGGDEAAATAHVESAQALRKRMLADPVSRSFVRDPTAPSTGAGGFAALVAAEGDGAGAGDADHTRATGKGRLEGDDHIRNHADGGARKKFGEKTGDPCRDFRRGSSGDSGTDAGDRGCGKRSGGEHATYGFAESEAGLLAGDDVEVALPLAVWVASISRPFEAPPQTCFRLRQFRVEKTW